jgi:hypothetical protein
MTREVVHPGLLAVTIGGHEEYLTRHDLRIARRQIEREDSDGYARVRGLRLDESQLAALEADMGAPAVLDFEDLRSIPSLPHHTGAEQ